MKRRGWTYFELYEFRSHACVGGETIFFPPSLTDHTISIHIHRKLFGKEIKNEFKKIEKITGKKRGIEYNLESA